MNEIYVAKLGKSVGLKGEMKIFIDSDFPEQFKKGAIFTTNKDIKLTVKSFNETRGTISFEELKDCDTAKKLTNQQLFSSLSDTKESCILNENQFFWFDIVDCMIYEDSNLLGKVIEVHRYPISDYLEIKTDKLLVEQKLPTTFLLPYEDKYILNVDIKNKKINVKDAKAILENS